MILTPLPEGHGRLASDLTAAWEPSDPSVASRIFIAREEAGESLGVARTTSTEQCAERRTASATLPRRKRARALCPCEPTMMKSAPHFLAYSAIAFRGKPTRTSEVVA